MTKRVKIEGKGSHTIVPALPGYSVVHQVVDEDHKILELGYTPIIAWLVIVEYWKGPNRDEGEHMCEPFPITADGIQGNKPHQLSAPTGIRYPDGTIGFWDRRCDSEEAALQYLRELNMENEMERKGPPQPTIPFVVN